MQSVLRILVGVEASIRDRSYSSSTVRCSQKAPADAVSKTHLVKVATQIASVLRVISRTLVVPTLTVAALVPTALSSVAPK